MTASQKRQDGSLELTSAMIEAGVEELWKYDPDYTDDEKAVRRIVAAVLAAQPRPPGDLAKAVFAPLPAPASLFARLSAAKRPSEKQ